MGAVLIGLEQFEQKIDAMGKALTAEALRRAGKMAAEPIVIEAEANAPRRIGALAGGIASRVSAQSSASEVSVTIGTRGKQFYGYFAEFGTGTMFNASAARSRGYPGGHGRKGKAGGTPAHPFLFPAFDHHRDSSLAILAAEFKSIVESYREAT